MSNREKDVDNDMWIGCGCDECRKVGDILRRLEPVMRIVVADLARSENLLVSNTIEQLIEVLSMMATVHISGAMQAADSFRSISSCVMERAREFQTRNIVHSEVEASLRRMMISVGSQGIDPMTSMPPGFPQPGQVLCPGCDCGRDDKDGGKGGNNLH